MSEDEKDMICGQVIRQHSEAKKTLACLKEKEAKLGDMLKRLSAALLGARSGGPHVFAVVSGNQITLQGDHERYYDDIAWPTKEELIGLLTEEKRVTKQITDLEQRLKELGYGDYAR